MQAFPQSIYPELVNFGGIRKLSGALDEKSYEVGGMQVETPGGFEYEVTLTNTGEAILLQGKVRIRVRSSTDGKSNHSFVHMKTWVPASKIVCLQFLNGMNGIRRNHMLLMIDSGKLL